MAIRIRKKEIQDEILRSIKRDLSGSLDEEIGPAVDSQAVAGAQSWMHDRVNDPDVSGDQPEFRYRER